MRVSIGWKYCQLNANRRPKGKDLKRGKACDDVDEVTEDERMVEDEMAK